MISKLLCGIGLHKRRGRTKFLPSIHAPIVQEVTFSTYCAREGCGRTLDEHRLRWNGKDMVPVEDLR